MIRRKVKWTKDEINFSLAVINPYLFTMMFWKEDMTVQNSRTDLPKEWRGKQVISREQRLMMLDNAQKVQFCMARKICKTICLESHYFQYPILNLLTDKATEGMFYTPREIHRDPVIGRIKTKSSKTPLFSILKESFNEGKQEFRFKTNFVWYNRIEGNPSMAGQNMVGPRCSYMIGDEGAYGNDGAYTERLNTALPDAKWLWCGVPNGIRGTKFHSISESKYQDSGWSVHRGRFSNNPIYHSMWAFKRLEEDHNGRNNQGFVTQVLGEWGEAMVASFPILPQSDEMPFTFREINGSKVSKNAQELMAALSIKIPHKYDDFIIGGDLGQSPSPTILSIMCKIEGIWWHIATTEVILANNPMQASIIDSLATKVLPKRPLRVCIDAHGSGAGTLGILHDIPGFDNSYYRMYAVDAGFSGAMPDPRIMIHKTCRQRIRYSSDGYWYCDQCKTLVLGNKDTMAAMIPSKQFLTSDMKESFLNGQEYLDNRDQYVIGQSNKIVIVLHRQDKLLLEELAGTTETESENGMIHYHPPVKDRDHRTDSIRACIRAIQSLDSESSGYANLDINQFGFMEIEGENESNQYGW